MSDINELAAALNAFQAEVVTVGKKADNPFFKSRYAPLDAIMKEALPVLTKHGLAVTQLVTHLEGHSALRTVLMHKSGQSIEDVMPLLLPKNDPQGQGSAITYARRYSYAAVLGLVIDEDDDGNKAVETRQAQGPAQAAKPAPGKNASVLPASPKQKELMAKLLRERGVADEDMKGYLIEQFGIADPSNVTVEQASFAIDELIAAQKDLPRTV